jgi:hypothetical protein
MKKFGKFEFGIEIVRFRATLCGGVLDGLSQGQRVPRPRSMDSLQVTLSYKKNHPEKT